MVCLLCMRALRAFVIKLSVDGLRCCFEPVCREVSAIRGRKEFGNCGDGFAGDGVRFDHPIRSPAGVPGGNEQTNGCGCRNQWAGIPSWLPAEPTPTTVSALRPARCLVYWSISCSGNRYSASSENVQ